MEDNKKMGKAVGYGDSHCSPAYSVLHPRELCEFVGSDFTEHTDAGIERACI